MQGVVESQDLDVIGDPILCELKEDDLKKWGRMY